MMEQRPIEFRAWDKTEKKMQYLSHMDICYVYSCLTFTGAILNGICQWPEGDDSEIYNQVIMQYTGLKDKNGVKIFEGDIVKVYTLDGGSQLGTVEWRDGGLILNRYNEYFNPVNHGFGEKEVIGNIYENPELLESK